MVARAATDVTGLPPKAEIVRPWNESASSAVVIVAPAGEPLAMPFAQGVVSGVTSHCSMPNHFFPVRPEPGCTSSAINRAPEFLTILKTNLKYFGGGGVEA